MYGPCGPGDASSHRKATSKSVFCLSSSYLTDINPLTCAYCNFNRVVLSGLMVEGCTLQLLEILIEESDYRVMLSKVNLRARHLWNFVEEVEQGIHVPSFDLILPIL